VEGGIFRSETSGLEALAKPENIDYMCLKIYTGIIEWGLLRVFQILMNVLAIHVLMAAHAAIL